MGVRRPLELLTGTHFFALPRNPGSHHQPASTQRLPLPIAALTAIQAMLGNTFFPNLTYEAPVQGQSVALPAPLQPVPPAACPEPLGQRED